jgi:hypothetical protein
MTSTFQIQLYCYPTTFLIVLTTVETVILLWDEHLYLLFVSVRVLLYHSRFHLTIIFKNLWPSGFCSIAGNRWRSWLRHCATSRKGFHWHNPFGLTMTLGSTSLLTEMSTRNSSCLCVGLTTLPPSCADCPEIWEPQPLGTLRACPGL